MQKLKRIFSTICAMLILAMIPINAHAGFVISTSNDFRTQFNNFKEQYSIFVTIFMSIMLLTSIAVFIYHCTMLATSSANAQKRAEAIRNLLITGCCLSAQSAISLVITLFFWGFYV